MYLAVAASAAALEVFAAVFAVLLSSALEACEAYYQAFQFVVWSGMDAQSAVSAVMFETVGEA